LRREIKTRECVQKSILNLTVAEKIRKKDENMHIYANFNPENELILQQNSEFYGKQLSNGIK